MELQIDEVSTMLGMIWSSTMRRTSSMVLKKNPQEHPSSTPRDRLKRWFLMKKVQNYGLVPNIDNLAVRFAEYENIKRMEMNTIRVTLPITKTISIT